MTTTSRQHNIQRRARFLDGLSTGCSCGTTPGLADHLTAHHEKRFYHSLVSEVRAEIDILDDWSANRSDDNKTSPRAHRADGLALAFAQGTAATGRSTGSPQLRKKPGTVTLLELQRSTSQDPQQMEFERFSEAVEERPQTLWLLLFHRSADNESVSLEVSLPLGVSDDGKILGWDKRIVFGEIGANDQIMEVRDDGRNTSDDVAVAISAR